LLIWRFWAYPHESEVLELNLAIRITIRDQPEINARYPCHAIRKPMAINHGLKHADRNEIKAIRMRNRIKYGK
jgi:hypothetical protein